MRKIKIILSVFAFILLSYTIQSCIRNNNEYTKQQTTNDKAYTDSIVSLQIKSIKLGYPLEGAIKYAKEQGYIYDDIYTYDFEYYKKTSCYANFELPNGEENFIAKLNIEIISYQDTITNIIIESRNYDSWWRLKDLYNSKYNEDYATEDFDYGYEYNNGYIITQDYKKSLIWSFKNQTLKFTTDFEFIDGPTSSIELYINRHGKTFVSDNKYFDSYSITYTDLYHYEKMKIHEEYLQAIEKRKKEIEDSIKKEEMKIKQEESKRKSEETKQKTMQDI